MNITNKQLSSESIGNVLFLILIAVALFAALSYAVTSSTRGSGVSTKGEEDELAASAVLQWLSSVDTAAQRMQVIQGYEPENISFGYEGIRNDGTITLNYMHNNGCSSSDCRVFHPAGGGVAPSIKSGTVQYPTGSTSTTIRSGQFLLYPVQWPDAGTSANDIVMRMQGMSPRTCKAINKAGGIEKVVSVNGSGNLANNLANWDTSVMVVSGTPSEVSGKRTFGSPTLGTGDGQYCDVWHLLLSR